MCFVARDAQRGYDKAAAAMESNRAIRQGGAALNPEFLFDSIHEASDLAVATKIAGAALIYFKKKEVKGKFVSDLDAKTTKELQAREKLALDAEAKLAEAETAHKENMRDYEDLQRRQTKASQKLLDQIHAADEDLEEEADGLKSCAVIREKIVKLFEPVSAELVQACLIDRAQPEEGDPTYQPFSNTHLGQEVFTSRGSVNYEFWEQLNILEEVRCDSYLSLSVSLFSQHIC